MQPVIVALIEDGGYLDLGYGYPIDKEFGPTEEKKVIQWAFAVDGGAMTSYKGFLVSCLKIIDPELCRRLINDGSVAEVVEDTSIQEWPNNACPEDL